MTLRIILFPSKISYNLRTGLAEDDLAEDDLWVAVSQEEKW